MNASGMKTIRTFSNLSEAGFASSLLEAAGIKASLADEQSFSIGYGQVGGGLRLQVEDADAERAERVLDKGPDAAGDRPSEAETAADERGRIPLGVFAAVAVAFGVLAFAIYQVVEKRRAGGSASAEQKYEYDYNRDGRPDCFYFYRNNQIVRSEIDHNFDGRIDEKLFFDAEGKPQSAEMDKNLDGRPDEWLAYENGSVASSRSDSDFNGRADWFSSYKHGVLVRSEVIPNETGNVARRLEFHDGVLTEEWVDENRDGVFDYMILHDPFGGMSERIPIKRAK